MADRVEPARQVESRAFDESRLVKPEDWDVDDELVMDQFAARVQADFDALKKQVASERAPATTAAPRAADADKAAPSADSRTS